MSFTFGSFATESLGMIATLKAWPSVDGLQIETLEAVGSDGQFLGGTTRAKTQFVFDVILSGSTATEAATKRDSFVMALDPERGVRPLTIDAAPGWYWQAILAGRIEWRRVTWDAGAGYVLRADVAFDALDVYGRLVTDEKWEYTSAGTRTVKRLQGNAMSYPTVEVQGSLTAAQKVTVQVGGVEVEVGGPLSSSQVLRLDWDAFDFARWNGSLKVASVVRSMSTLDRPRLWPGEDATFKVTTTGSVSAVRLFANSRRQ